MFTRYLLFVAFLFSLASCEKKEDALVLPPPGTASHAGIAMGENYDKQVYFDFTDSVVLTSDLNSWDLAFEAAADGKHVFMNGGKLGATGDNFKGVFVYNTHLSDMQAVKDLPAGIYAYSVMGWSFDKPSGLPDSTGIGEWWDSNGISKAEVYIIITGDNKLQKMRILSVSNTAYTIEWAPLYGSSTIKTVVLPKDTAYNFVYFSFDQGITWPEPPKSSWDMVFTHYRAQIYDNSIKAVISYGVSGALLNPYNTVSSADSTTPFAQITFQMASALPTSNHRDIIGYDWKDYSISSGYYTVKPWKNYMVHTQRDQIFKMHFLGFYNSSGVKGYPSFEYERLR